MSRIQSRLSKLEKDTQPDQEQPSYISITDDEWDRLQAVEIEPGYLGIAQPLKVYIGISPDDWDIEPEK